jgi:hypothetical protein
MSAASKACQQLIAELGGNIKKTSGNSALCPRWHERESMPAEMAREREHASSMFEERGLLFEDG